MHRLWKITVDSTEVFDRLAFAAIFTAVDNNFWGRSIKSRGFFVNAEVQPVKSCILQIGKAAADCCTIFEMQNKVLNKFFRIFAYS